ncbi:MAG: arginine deiminase family protein [Pseudomonadota bacterium]
MSEYGAQNMVAPLARVIVSRPSSTMGSADTETWHYGAGLTQDALDEQHRDFIAQLEKCGAQIEFMDAPTQLYDAVFTHDPSLVSNHGAILMHMGKPLRRGEADAHAECYTKLGVPILGRIESPGSVEGGDCVWLDESNLVVGRGFRTNQAGIDQLCAMLEPNGVTINVFDLPVCHGEAACLHLMSIISLLDHNLALIYKPLMPVAFYQMLQSHGIEMIEADIDEFENSGGLSLNVLATAPRQCLAVAGFENTRHAMEAAGCSVDVFNGDDLCIKCEGGPTCLTRPLLRR